MYVVLLGVSFSVFLWLTVFLFVCFSLTNGVMSGFYFFLKEWPLEVRMEVYNHSFNHSSGWHLENSGMLIPNCVLMSEVSPYPGDSGQCIKYSKRTGEPGKQSRDDHSVKC